MIIAGGALIVSAVTAQMGLNPDDIKSWLSLITGIAGGALLALGVILCMVGSVPLGVGMIIAGSVSLVSAVALNSNVIIQKVKGFFNSVLNWVKTWGLLVIGIILLMSGVSTPLGIALIYKGAKNLTETKDPKWMWLLDKVKTVWKAVKDYWNSNIAKYFTKEWWGNLAKNAINGFLKWIVNGLNKLIDKLNSFGFNMPDVLGGGRVGFNIKRLDVPQLAKGAVIPGGKPFLAMLGDQPSGQTNIETPVSEMKRAFREEFMEMGAFGFNGRIEVPVYMDGKQIAFAVRESESAIGTQTVFGGFANAY